VRFYAVTKSFFHEGAIVEGSAAFAALKWDGQPKSERWKPVEVRLTAVGGGQRLLESDFLVVHRGGFFLSERAALVLSDVLLANGELLPLTADGDRYLAFNPLDEVDALDPKRTWYWPTQDYPDGWVETPAFRPEAVAGRRLVRLPQTSLSPFYVDGSFKRRVERAGLQGLRFRLVWSDDPTVPIRPTFGSSGDFWRAWEAAEAARRGETPEAAALAGEQGEEP
jgi:hypothetical protein